MQQFGYKDAVYNLIDFEYLNTKTHNKTEF